jgi:hypothetical protein
MPDVLLTEGGDRLVQEDGAAILLDERGAAVGAGPSVSFGDVVRPRVTSGAGVPVFVTGGADVEVRILWGDDV